MQLAQFGLRVLSALILYLPFAAALQNVTVGGRYLYTADGNRFYIKGIAYQPQGMCLPVFEMALLSITR